MIGQCRRRHSSADSSSLTAIAHSYVEGSDQFLCREPHIRINNLSSDPTFVWSTNENGDILRSVSLRRVINLQSVDSVLLDVCADYSRAANKAFGEQITRNKSHGIEAIINDNIWKLQFSCSTL